MTSQAVCNHTLNSIYFLNQSPINTTLTSVSYVHASKYICFSTNVTTVTIAMSTCISIILPITCQISVPLLPQCANNFKIVSQNYAL